MRLNRVRIENFRSIADLDCDFGAVTTFVGPNGAGKSNVLRALDWFFNGDKGTLTIDDVHQGAAVDDARIRVRVDFVDLTDADRQALGARYGADPSATTFTAWRTWEDGEDKVTAKALAFLPFEDIRRSRSASEKRASYSQLRSDHPEYNLPTCSSAAAVDQAMEEWERNRPEELTDAEISDTHFFGFNSRGKLSELFDFVFVSADLRAADETALTKSSILSRILQRAIQRDELDQATAELAERFTAELTSLSEEHLGDQLRSLQAELSAEVAAYSQGREIRLRDEPVSLKPGPAGVSLQVSDSSIATPVSLQGHGFQRTLLMSALTVLSKRARGGAAGQMFLAIEEPELFQHPTRAKAFASVLRHLAEAPNQRTQVAYATHSPYFVDPRFFDQVRRVSPSNTIGAACASSRVTVASVADVERRLDGYVSSESLTRRWDQVCLKYLPEALFAESVILVEGDEDAAILEGMGKRVNELAVSGICVAPVSGKSNMMIPFAILELLGIPALMVVDNDSGKGERMRRDGKDDGVIAAAEAKTRQDNRTFCRFVGAPEDDYPVGATDTTLAFIPDTMESLLASDLPGWDLTRRQLIESGRGVDGKNAATYAIAAKECADTPGPKLQRLLNFCASNVA